MSRDGLRRLDTEDLSAAGIPKRDDRDRKIDVHALRHTFETNLSKAGVSPRVAQAAMRHSSVDLMMNVYTDPRLLDVQGTVESLPSMTVTSDRTENRQRIAVGAENFARCFVAVPVAVPPDFPRDSQSTPVTLLGISSEADSANTTDSYSLTTNEKRSPLANNGERLEMEARGRQ